MIRSLSVIAVLIMVFSALSVSGQAEMRGKYVFVISKVNYLKAIEDAVNQSKAAGIELSEARVILCGESVKAFAEENAIVTKALQNPRIKLFACGLSLDQMKIDPSVLPDNVSMVRNGILEAMKLENKGYRKYDL